MGISNTLKEASGTLTIQIEGFFTERFINLCRINNIKIWDIRQIVQGVIRLNIHTSDFKKLKPIAKKTKCKVKIKNKRGIYFKLLKYKSRKIFLYLLAAFVIFILLFSSFIWQINVIGNDKISKEEIIGKLKQSGVYVGKCKIGLSKKEVVNSFRANMPDISWAGINIYGTNLEIEVVEKTVAQNADENSTQIGDIFANKSGIITKIVAENGTAKLKTGSYVESGYMLIEGIIKSEVIGIEDVHAKGIIRVNNSYDFEKEYKFNQIKKEYTNSKKYTIGISINDKENFINYLNKTKKYDKLKQSKQINIFGKNITLDFYTFTEYTENEVVLTKEQLISQGNEDGKKYIEEIVPTLKNSYFVDEQEYITDTSDGIKYKKTYTINEEIGEFKAR